VAAWGGYTVAWRDRPLELSHGALEGGGEGTGRGLHPCPRAGGLFVLHESTYFFVFRAVYCYTIVLS